MNTQTPQTPQTPLIIGGIDTTGMSEVQIKGLKTLEAQARTMAQTASALIQSDARVTRACVKILSLCGGQFELANVALAAVHASLNTPEAPKLEAPDAPKAEEAPDAPKAEEAQAA